MKIGKRRGKYRPKSPRKPANTINKIYESAGPEQRLRGTSAQIVARYQALANDARLNGDTVMSENFLQHAEHYTRLLNEAQRADTASRATSKDPMPLAEEMQADPGKMDQPDT